MKHCININHTEVAQLSEELNLHKAVVASKIAVWQEQNNNLDRFPTVSELEEFNKNQVSFNDTEKVSNMILSKLLIKSKPFFKRNRRNIKDDYWYNDDVNIARDTANELLKSITGLESSINMNDSIQAIKKNIHQVLSQDLVSKWEESLENIKEWKSFDTLDEKLGVQRLLKDVLNKGINRLSEYSEENQTIVKDYLKSLFKDNKYTSEKQGLFLANKNAQKRLSTEIARESNMRSMFNMKKKAIIGKYETLLNLAKLDPDYKQRIENKINNEIDRRIAFQNSEFNKNPNISKVRKFRELWGKSLFWKEQNDLQRKVESKDVSIKINSLFDNMNYEAESGDVIADSTTVDFLNKIIDQNSSYSELAKHLLPFAKKHNVSISLIHKLDDGIAGRNEIKLGHGTNKNGEPYSYITDEDIFIDYTSPAYKVDPERLILHELVHSLSSIYIASEKEKNKNLKKDNPISVYMKYVQDYANKERDVIRQGSYFFGFGDMPYAFENEQEFVAEALTNPFFIEVLKNIPAMESTRFNSLFEEILSWIAKIFNINTHNNAYDQLYDIIHGILDTQSEFNFYAEIESDSIDSNQSSNKTPYPQAFAEVKSIPYKDNIELYKKYDLLDKNGNRKSLPFNDKTKKWVNTLNLSPYYSFALIKDSNEKYRISVLPKQDGQLGLFQLESEKPQKEVNKDLDNKLKQQLGELGISIKSIDEFMDKHNVSPAGVSDIIKGIIYIDANKANELTLPEETAHFIIELLGETPLAKRLLALVEANDYYKEVLGSEFDSYSEVYKSNKDMLVREAAGKLLSQAIVSKFNEQNSGIPFDKLNLLERLWMYAKNLFNKITKQRFNKDILDAYGNTADQFLRGTLSGLDTKNLTRKITMFQISDKALNNLKEKLDKSKEAIAKRISVYKRKDLKKLALREEETLTTLIEDLDDKNYLTAALNVAESARDRFVKVNKRIVELEKSIENLELQGNDGLLALASTLKDMKSFTNSYLPMMKEIKLEMTKMSISEEENEDIKKISAILTDTIDKAELLDSEYYKMAKPIYARFISPLIGNGPITDINGVLELGGEDITFFQRWVDSAANSGEPMLQIIDLIVKDAKQEAKDESYDIMKDIIDARMKLEDHGIKDTKWIYEKKKDGTLSGNNVSEWNYGDWQDSKDKSKADTLERIRRSNKNIELPERDSDLLDEVFKNDVLIAQYKTLMNSWHKYNSQKNPYADDIIAMKARELSDEDFEEWYDENTHLDEFSGTLYYKNELSVPAEKYRNSQYTEIMSNPAKKEFYNLTMNMKESLDSKLPQNRRLGKLAPQLRTDFIQKMKSSKNVSELARNAKESIREQFQNVEDDTEMGDRFKMTDENGNPVNFLPIYFTGKLANSKDLSTDFAESMSAFASMATDYSKMSKVLDMLEMGRDIISNRDLISKDANGNVLKESINILGKKIAKSIKKDPNSSNLKARLDDYFLMNIYGKTRSEGTDFNILGFKINSEKALDMLGRYTSLNNLALNIYAGIQNPLVGNSAIRLEAIAGQFFSNKDLLAADAKYAKTLANNMANVGSRNPKDWLSLWMEKMEVMQDFSRKSKEINMDRRGLISKLFSSNTLFFMSHAGEHQMQNRTSLALANSIKLKDADGKDITLIEAFEIVGNKLVLKSGVKKLDGTAFTEADIRQFKRKQNAINNSLHGIYNDQDLLAIQQYGLLRQALIFRKFMRPGFNRRFRKKYYNYEGQFDVEGYYRTTGRFVATLAKDLKRGQFLLAAHWKELTELEKQNIIRTATEAGYMLAVSLLLNFILPMMGGDDDDRWLASMVAYQANRLNVELKFYVDPRQTLKILNSPAAGIDQLNKALNLLAMATNPWYAGEVITRGKYEGYTRLHKASIGAIPFMKTIGDWQTPSDKLVFFTLQNK